MGKDKKGEDELTPEEYVLEKINVKMFDSESNDQLTKERGRCLEKSCDVRKYFLELRECTKRVRRKIKYTAETCHQETVDLMESLDRCVHDKAFHKMV
ncbi:ubiquinol-cytochrome C reductase hinge protein domain-containing protein [Phthorimaea operculella]|nr:ubiquinol-cytochrome C reductase hinge protein domain-containing protein [Phthorimaea operculella]